MDKRALQEAVGAIIEPIQMWALTRGRRPKRSTGGMQLFPHTVKGPIAEATSMAYLRGDTDQVPKSEHRSMVSKHRSMVYVC